MECCELCFCSFVLIKCFQSLGTAAHKAMIRNVQRICLFSLVHFECGLRESQGSLGLCVVSIDHNTVLQAEERSSYAASHRGRRLSTQQRVVVAVGYVLEQIHPLRQE